jgi:alpha-D-ribose 1-methylphosphonate 5-triphosphate diphosphatase PhnM
MTTVTFDTLQLVDKLKAAGFQQAQAEAVIRVIAEAQDTLVTQAYFDHKLEKELASIKTDQAVQKWMTGVLLAGVLSLVLKAFF